MNAKSILDAIGGINDRHILEFVDVEINEKNKKKYIYKMLPFVASFGMVLLISIGFWGLYHNSPFGDGNSVFPSESEEGESTEDTNKPLIDMDKVVWGNGFQIFDYETDYENVQLGRVYIAKSLENAFEEYVKEETVFAIYVENCYGTKEKVYKEFVLPTGMVEEYMSKGVIYATQKQIEEMVCPENMTIVLHLANKERHEIVVTKDNVDEVISDYKKVAIWIDDSDGVTQIMYQVAELEKSLSLEEVAKIRRNMFKKLTSERISEILLDYDIVEDEVEYKGAIISVFVATLSKDTIVKLLDDERVSTIYVVYNQPIYEY